MGASKSQSHDLFDERKATQAASWLLLRAGGFLSRLKLMHLLYLAERCSLESHAVTLSGDLLVSTRDGPALARIRNLVNGANLAINGVWARLIVNSFDQMLALRNPDELESPETQLSALSDSDAEILDEVDRKSVV